MGGEGKWVSFYSGWEKESGCPFILAFILEVEWVSFCCWVSKLFPVVFHERQDFH